MAVRFLLPLLLMTSVLARRFPRRGCELRDTIDLARQLDEDSVFFTIPFTPANLSEVTTFNITYRTIDFCVGEHTSTHVDAPYHFNENGWKVAEIPLKRLIANGVFMNFSLETANNVSFRLEPYHIDQWIEEHGRLPRNAMVLISYGWAQLYPNRTAFTGSTTDEFFDFVFPGMSADTARYLASMQEIVGVGVDTVSADPSGSGEAHQILTAQNIYLLENVDMNQPCLPARGYKVFTMPIKLTNGTGGPARVIVVPDYQRHRG